MRRRAVGGDAVRHSWGLDLTDLPGHRRPLLAILDHGTRACLFLQELHTKSAIALARALVHTVKRYGLPRSLRTDNEPSLCSLTFRAILWLSTLRKCVRAFRTSRGTPVCVVPRGLTRGALAGISLP